MGVSAWIMSFLPDGQNDEEESTSRAQQIDDAQSVRNSANLLKSMKHVKVQNVCGSTAGAGSGTFHKYRQAKRRENFRLEQLKKEHRINEMNERIKKRKRENDAILEKKRSKKRKIRERKKMRRQRAAKAAENGIDGKEDDDEEENNVIECKENDDENDEDKELEELMNIDRTLSNKQSNENNDNEQEQDEDEDYDLNQHKTDTKNEENLLKNTEKENETLSKKQKILAALAAEFG